jgi:hypothetical protein
MTAALLPALGVLLVAKPNLGLAIFAYRPNRTAVIASAALLALSLALLPHWPLDWLHSLALDRRSATHPIPLLTPLGAVLVLALLRWRRPEARLLFAMACVPQLLFFYDQLALWLVPRSSRESLWLTLASGLAFLAMILLAPTDAERPRVATQCVLLGVYWPALGMVLRRPNVATDSGDARPSRAERDRERETEGEIAGARAR